MQYWYAFKFNFVVAHYYGAIVFVASLVIHVAVKTPIILRAYRERGVLRPLRDDLERHAARAAGPRRPGARAPRRRPTLSRRGLFAFVGAGSLALLVANVGQTIGGPLRPLAFLAPRRGDGGRRAHRLPGQQDRCERPHHARRWWATTGGSSSPAARRSCA